MLQNVEFDALISFLWHCELEFLKNTALEVELVFDTQLQVDL